MGGEEHGYSIGAIPNLLFCCKTKKFFRGGPGIVYDAVCRKPGISQLENQVGTPLFLRTSKGVSLTAEGKILYEYARSALGLIHTAEEKLQRMAKLELGELRICAGDTVSKYYFSPVWKCFTTSFLR